MLVVFDTNILVSALLSPSGKPAQVFRRTFKNFFELTCGAFLAEYTAFYLFY